MGMKEATQHESKLESFLDLYMQYTSKQESPAMFHLWTGITILSAALGRKCYINRGYYKLYPNIFCILVAGSARCRKSTAINIGVKLLEEIPTTKVISGKITPEKFIKELADTSQEVETDGKKEWKTPAALVHSSELSVFLTKQSYGEPLIHVLTDLFDCPDTWTYKTKNRGEEFLRNVFISIIAATTPDGIAKGIPESAMKEGFASRVLFVYQPDTDRRNAFPVLTPEELAQYVQLRKMILERVEIGGEFTLSPEGIEWFKAWYDYHMNEPIPDKRLEGMYGRKHDHLLRVAMVLAGDRLTTTVQPYHLDAALVALNSLENAAPGAFHQMGGDDLTPHIERAKSFMKRFGRITYSELLKKLYPVNALTFKTIVETMAQSGQVARDPEKASILVWLGD